MELSGWCDTFHLPKGSEHAFKNRQLDPLKLSLEGLRVVRYTREEGSVQIKGKEPVQTCSQSHRWLWS